MEAFRGMDRNEAGFVTKEQVMACYEDSVRKATSDDFTQSMTDLTRATRCASSTSWHVLDLPTQHSSSALRLPHPARVFVRPIVST